jgi:hypothetical protein
VNRERDHRDGGFEKFVATKADIAETAYVHLEAAA